MKPCNFILRVASMFYDSILLAAVLFAATAVLLPVTGGDAIESGNPLYFLYLVGWSFAFFGWQWTHGGQTLGMRAWKVRVTTLDGGPLTWPQAVKRFLLAILSWLLLGTGFLWALIDGDKRSLHDRWSGTRLVKLDKNPDITP